MSENQKRYQNQYKVSISRSALSKIVCYSNKHSMLYNKITRLSKNQENILPPRVAAKLDDNPNWFSINLGKNVANPVVTKASEDVDITKHIKTVFLIKF